LVAGSRNALHASPLQKITVRGSQTAKRQTEMKLGEFEPPTSWVGFQVVHAA